MSEVCSNCQFSIQDFPDLFCTVRKLSTKDGLFVTCHHYLPKTLFDQITQSPETLAERLVYRVWDEFEIDWVWYSTVLKASSGRDFNKVSFNTKEEAIAATVAKLKEVAQ